MAGELGYDPATGQLVYEPTSGQLALDCVDFCDTNDCKSAPTNNAVVTINCTEYEHAYCYLAGTYAGYAYQFFGDICWWYWKLGDNYITVGVDPHAVHGIPAVMVYVTVPSRIMYGAALTLGDIACINGNIILECELVRLSLGWCNTCTGHLIIG